MTGSFDLLKPGVSRYHHVGLIVPILCGTVPFLVAPYFRSLEKHHHILTALVLGFLTGCFAYVLMRYVPLLKDPQYTLNKAALLGLLTAEIMIFTFPRGDWDDRIVSPPMLIFYLFMFLFGISEIERE